MKKSLGSMFKIFLLLFNITLLFGQGFTTASHLSKESLYVKEPLILTFDINQTDNSKVMFFTFSPKKSKDYEFYRINVEEKNSDQKVQLRYTYLLYPLTAGDINITLNLTQKSTTQENINANFSRDRELAAAVSTQDTIISLSPLPLHIKTVPQDTMLVGDFKLTSTVSKHQTDAYAPLPWNIEIKGDGYPPKIDTLLHSTPRYTLFQGKPQVSNIHTAQGTYNQLLYVMALSAKESFTLDELPIKAFNPATQKSYTLSIPKESFIITQVAQKNLLDSVDSPLPYQSTDFSWMGTVLGYFVAFVAGFLSAKSVQWHKKSQKNTTSIASQIAQCDDAKTLLSLLIAEDSKRYITAIEELEAHIYERKSIDIKKLKRAL